MDGAFAGKVAFVIGAARGFGQALSASLAGRGAAVAMADIDETERAAAPFGVVCSAHGRPETLKVAGGFTMAMG